MLGPKTEHAYRVLGSHGLGQQSEHAHELQDFTGWDINAHMHTELQDLTGKDLRPNMHTELQDWGCRISWVRNTRSNMPSRCQDGAEGTHGLGTLDRTCLRGISSGLQDLKRSAHQIEHAYEVSGWDCRISRVGNTRSTVPTGYKDGAAGSHRQGTSDRTCLQGIRSGLQDLTGCELQIVHAYYVSGVDFRISWVRNTRLNVSTMCLTGLEQQITHAYEVSGRGCKISRVRNTRS